MRAGADAGGRADPPTPLFGNQNQLRPSPKCRHFFIRGTQIRNYCGPRYRQSVGALARGYCFHVSNASAKARSSGRTLFHGEDGATVVVVDHRDVEPATLLQQLKIAPLVVGLLVGQADRSNRA